MSKFASRIIRFLRSEDGPAAVEYAIMLAVIIIASIGAVLIVGDVQRLLFTETADTMNDAMFDN